MSKKKDIEIAKANQSTYSIIPAESKLIKTDLIPKNDSLTSIDSLTRYIQEINRYELLSPEQEEELTRALHETGDIDIAKKLVVANLRLVVKIAMEYKKAYSNILDLIQEGNIGLMKAVSKFDPNQGAKLSYYASWWIKSYILKFILDNFRLVKVGTTAEQKKLFYNLYKEKERLEKQGISPTAKLIATNLGVSEDTVHEMDKRIGEESGDFSLDYQSTNDHTNATYSIQDTLSSDEPLTDEIVEKMQSLEILEENLDEFIKGLKARDRDIFTKRLMSEVPPSLQSIADEYGVSRERIRQIEERLLNNLKLYMKKYLR